MPNWQLSGRNQGYSTEIDKDNQNTHTKRRFLHCETPREVIWHNMQGEYIKSFTNGVIGTFNELYI